MKKISVVVPVYKVELYISKCIESLINQSYSNIEIILVDDGSPDNCPKICDDWSKKDKRIKVIHKKNGGLSDARNSGIENATGDYICFVDSDDYVQKEYVKKLLEANLFNNTKISECGIRYINNDGEVLKEIGYNDDIILSGREMICDQYKDHDVENVVAWNRLYEISLFKKIRFPKGKIHEDEYTTYKLLYSQDKVSIIKDKLYNYRQTDNSIMRSSFNLKRLDVLDGLLEKMDFFYNKQEIDLYYLTIAKYLSNIRFLYCNVKKNYPEQSELLSSMYNEYRKYYKISKKYKSYSLAVKIKNILFFIFPNLYYRLKNNL